MRRRLLIFGALAAQNPRERAYGDAHAHCYRDYFRYKPVAPHFNDYSPNPTFNQLVLYPAPLGHATHGTTPDLVRADFEKFAIYFAELATLLNGGPLNRSQAKQVADLLAGIYAELKRVGDSESSVFKRYWDPDDPYDPDAHGWRGVFSRQEFKCEQGPKFPLPVEQIHLPTDAEVQALITRIKHACWP